MRIAVFIFFFHAKASTKRFFFSTTLVVLYHSDAQEFDNKIGFNPSSAKPKLIRRTAYHSFSQKLREISQMSS